MVIAADAIGLERAAARAAVHERPLTVLANLDRDGFHRAPARAPTIAGLVIKVTRPEAAWAMVAVIGAKASRFDKLLADDAREGRVGV